jgi:hypothetical protein
MVKTGAHKSIREAISSAPQRLKPLGLKALYGAAEAAPFQRIIHEAKERLIRPKNDL